jgi:hypothetical protein
MVSQISPSLNSAAAPGVTGFAVVTLGKVGLVRRSNNEDDANYYRSIPRKGA